MMRKLIDRGNSLLLKSKYNYVPVSNYEVQKKQNPIIEVTLGSQTGKHFNIHFRLFQNTVPKTTENFKRLLLGTAVYKNRSLTLVGNHFHNVVPRSFVELGHLEGGNCSIYGPTFRDQSFQLPHDRPGLLSCVSEENTNNSRFVITFAPCPFLDLKNVVFGQITAETIHQLKNLERLGNEITKYKILSTKQGEVKHDHHDSHGHSGHH